MGLELDRPRAAAAASAHGGAAALPGGTMHFEPQQGRWCGMHTLNALEQDSVFTRRQLTALADTLYKEERAPCDPQRPRRAPENHITGRPSQGTFDVLERALQERGRSVVYYSDVHA